MQFGNECLNLVLSFVYGLWEHCTRAKIHEKDNVAGATYGITLQLHTVLLHYQSRYLAKFVQCLSFDV